MIHKQFSAIIIKNLNLLFSTPIFLILNLTTVSVLFLLSCLPTYAIDDHHLLLRDQGQATIFFMSCLMCLFCSIKVITDDFRLHTISITLSRPISPLVYCAANLLSLTFFLVLMQFFFQINYLWLSEMASDNYYLNMNSFALFICTTITALLIPAFKQYFFGGRFILPANLWLLGLLTLGLIIRIFLAKQGAIDWLALQNSIMLFAASLTFTCFLFPFAILYNSSSVMIAGICIFFTGALSEYLFNQLTTFAPILKPLNALVPNWQIFWIIERLNEGYSISNSYYISCLFHTAIVFLITLTVSTLIVKKTEIAK